jgi:hypothetical protein
VQAGERRHGTVERVVGGGQKAYDRTRIFGSKQMDSAIGSPQAGLIFLAILGSRIRSLYGLQEVPSLRCGWAMPQMQLVDICVCSFGGTN